MTYRKIRECKYTYPDEPTVSDDAKNFISLILVKSPHDRPSLESLLWHPFINGKVEIPESLNFKCLFGDEKEYIQSLLYRENPTFGMSYQDHISSLHHRSKPRRDSQLKTLAKQ